MSEKQFGLAWLPVSGHHKSVCIRAGFSPCKFYHIGHSKFFCSASITPWIRSIFLLNSGLAILQLSHESINKKNKQIEAIYNKANLRDLIAATSLVISNWIQIVNFSVHVTKKFDGCPRKTTEHFFYTKSSFVRHFKSIGEFKLDLPSRNTQFGSKLVICYPVWPWNLMDDLGKQ